MVGQRASLTLIVVIAAFATAAACSPSSATPSQAAASSQPSASASASPAATQQATPVASVAVGATLPASWPTSFPLPTGAQPVYTVSSGDGMLAWFSTPTGTDVAAAFQQKLAPAGWKIDNTFVSSSADGTVTVLDISSPGWKATVWAGKGGPSSGFTGDYSFFVVMTKQ